MSIQAILVLAMAFGPDVTRFGLLTCTNIHILLAKYLARTPLKMLNPIENASVIMCAYVCCISSLVVTLIVNKNTCH